MPNLSIRGLDEETARLLKRAARNTGISVNAKVIEFVRQALGMVKPGEHPLRHTDLDHLAGTWSEQDSREFEERTAPFEVVDEELWR